MSEPTVAKPKAAPSWPRPKVHIPRFLYFVLSVVFLADVALTGRAFVLRDIVTFFHPWQHAVRESIRAGHLPLWNHDTFCGIPLLANLQSGVFYPVNWLYSLLPFDWALTFGMVAHLTIAGVLMRSFLKRIGLRNLASFLGGALFAYGTWTISYLEFPMKLGSAVWLPLVWSGLWETMRLGRRRGLAFSGIGILLSLLGGYPQLTFFGLISGSLWALVLLPGVLAETTVSAPHRILRLAAWPVAVLVGGLAAGVQLLPAAEMAEVSSKAAPYEASVALARSLPPAALIGLVDPFFFGFPGIDRFWGGEVVEFSYGTFYVGALSLILLLGAGATFFRPRKGRYRREDLRRVPRRTIIPRVVPWFLALGIVTGIALALGRHTPIYPFLFEHVPGFGRSRWPATATYLISVHASALAGVGLQAILADHQRVRRASFAAIGLGIVMLATWLLAQGPLAESMRTFQLAGAPAFQTPAYEQNHPWWLTTLLIRGALVLAAGGIGLTLFEIRSRVAFSWIALLMLDLFLTGRTLDFPSARGFYERTPESLVAMKEKMNGHRVFTPRSTDQLGNFLYGSRNLTSFDWARQAMLCNANVPVGIPQAHGCDPLNPRRHEAFVQAFSSEDTPWELKERIFDLWDASVLITAPEIQPAQVPMINDPGAGIELSRHEPRLGRAMLMSGWDSFDDGETLLGRLLSRGHDPQEMTLLEAIPEGPGPITPRRAPSDRGETMLYEAGPNSIEVAWLLGEAGMLRVLESWAPGWQATVNGQPVPIYRADFLFMAVPVPAGSCQVSFVYRPTSLRNGLYATLAGLLGIGICWFTDRRRHEPNQVQT